jgi:hypothetical protein
VSDTLQLGIVALVVGAALAYVVYRFFFASRRPPRRKRGPDVPLSRLRKGK